MNVESLAIGFLIAYFLAWIAALYLQKRIFSRIDSGKKLEPQDAGLCFIGSLEKWKWCWSVLNGEYRESKDSKLVKMCGQFRWLFFFLISMAIIFLALTLYVGATRGSAV